MNRLRVIRRHRHFVAAVAVHDRPHLKLAARYPDHSGRAFWRFARDRTYSRGKRERDAADR